MGRRQRRVHHDRQPVGIVVVGGDAMDRDLVLPGHAEAHARRPFGQLQLALDADGGEMLLHHLGGVLVHAELRARQHHGREAVRHAGGGEQALRLRDDRSASRATARRPRRACLPRSARLPAPCRGRRRRRLHDILAPDRMRDRAAHARVGERALGAVEQHVHERPVLRDRSCRRGSFSTASIDCHGTYSIMSMSPDCSAATRRFSSA